MFENIAIGSLFVVCILGLCIVYLKVKDGGHWTSKLEDFRPSEDVEFNESEKEILERLSSEFKLIGSESLRPVEPIDNLKILFLLYESMSNGSITMEQLSEYDKNLIQIVHNLSADFKRILEDKK